MKIPELTYTGVTVYSATRVFVSAVMDDEKTDHSLVLRWAGGPWTQTPVSDIVIGSAVMMDQGPVLVNVGATGEVKLLLSKGTARETIDVSDDGPNPRVPLRVARSIAGQVYAAGMARRIYCRRGPGQWEAMDAGLRVPRTDRDRAVGLLSIDGWTANDLIAVGYKGEIWHYDGKSWTQQKSPTDVALTSIRCGPDGLAYVAGLSGTFLRGHHGQWDMMRQNTTQDDFWGLAILRGKPYVATDRALYDLRGDDLRPVDLKPLGTVTLRHLDCNTEVMWSVGDKHLAATEDGIHWRIVPGPRDMEPQ